MPISQIGSNSHNKRSRIRERIVVFPGEHAVIRTYEKLPYTILTDAEEDPGRTKAINEILQRKASSHA